MLPCSRKERILMFTSRNRMFDIRLVTWIEQESKMHIWLHNFAGNPLERIVCLVWDNCNWKPSCLSSLKTLEILKFNFKIQGVLKPWQAYNKREKIENRGYSTVLPCLTLSLPESVVETCNVVLIFEPVNENVWCDHFDEISLAVLLCPQHAFPHDTTHVLHTSCTPQI